MEEMVVVETDLVEEVVVETDLVEEVVVETDLVENEVVMVQMYICYTHYKRNLDSYN